MRQRVAAKIFEATQEGHWSIDDVRRAGREALTSITDDVALIKKPRDTAGLLTLQTAGPYLLIPPLVPLLFDMLLFVMVPP